MNEPRDNEAAALSPGELRLTTDDCRFIRGVRNTVNATMYGLEFVVDALLVALVTRGHVLLEGNPGLGKTALVKTLSRALGLPDDRVGRIQFTPDLMPSDITGTLMPMETDVRRLEFQPGPIFRWLLLADEINRATPKTQAAMLEAMAERQVTVLNRTWPLTEPLTITWRGQRQRIEPPFMVMATQNPIDLEGTYELPEAQSDRFMFKIRMPFPESRTLVRIIQKETMAQSAGGASSAGGDGDAGLASNSCDEALLRLARIGDAVRVAEPLPSVQAHIVNMVVASEGRYAGDLALDHGSKRRLDTLTHEYFAFPLGPRAAFALMLGAKGWDVVALTAEDDIDRIGSRTNVGLARAALPALRHRLKLRLDWERRYREERNVDARRSSDQVHDALLREFVLLTAPDDHGYRAILEAELGDSA